MWQQKGEDTSRVFFFFSISKKKKKRWACMMKNWKSSCSFSRVLWGTEHIGRQMETGWTNRRKMGESPPHISELPTGGDARRREVSLGYRFSQSEYAWQSHRQECSHVGCVTDKAITCRRAKKKKIEVEEEIPGLQKRGRRCATEENRPPPSATSLR